MACLPLFECIRKHARQKTPCCFRHGKNIVETSDYRFYAAPPICQRGGPAMTKAHALALSPQDPPPGSQIEDAYRRLRDDIISGTLVPAEKLRIGHLRHRLGIGANALRESRERRG